MSEIFDDEAADEAPRRRGGRGRALIITAVVVVVLVIALAGFASIYTERLWFTSAGYGSVFSKLLWTKVSLFAVCAVLMAAVVVVNIYLAYRFRPFFRPTSPEQTSLDRYRDVVTPIRTWLVVAVGLVVAGFSGTSGMGHWRTYLLWRNAQPFDSDDPYFHKDIGFYVFQLPWWHFVVNFALAMLVLAIVAAIVVHYLYGGIRLQATQDKLSIPAQMQLSVLLGLFVLVKAVDYYLDRFDLVNQKGSLITGMTYTSDNAVLPAKNILIGVSVVCALLFFANVWRQTWQLPSVGLALLVLSAVLLGMIWPAIVQQFQVKPSQPNTENSYIAANIAATREAYDLNDVEKTTDTTSATSDPLSDSELIDRTTSVPLLDPQKIQPAFQQLQQSLNYYSTAPVLDVDRYELGGTQRALVLGARELDQSGIPASGNNWSNLHTVYTHGNGLIAAYANQRNLSDTASTGGAGGTGSDLVFAQGNGAASNPPSQDDLQKATGGFEDRIYYGQESPDYSIVGKAGPDSPDVELNLPTGGADDQATTTFTGQGDASVGSTFNQLMFALKFGDPNFLLSGRVNANSKVLFDRDPRERVQKVAPWLTVDSDPYPAVVDGHIEWILDGYTTTDRYPNSERESFDTMTADALQLNNGLQPLPTDEINYLRDSVKATVDAYDGTVTLYAWDESDPILKAWMAAFPGTVQPKSALTDNTELLSHMRYPEDLFKVQRYQYARYHVDNATDWYQNSDRWDVPRDPYNNTTFQAPYRMFLGDNGGSADAADSADSTFSLASVYVPYNKDTQLAAFMSVDSDATSPDYGKLRVLDLPTNATAEGPQQVVSNFVGNSAYSEAISGVKLSALVTYGNVLTFPVGGQLMYVQPVYLSRDASQSTSYPKLAYVLVSYGADIGFGATIDSAIANLDDSGSSPPSNNNGNNGNGGPTSTSSPNPTQSPTDKPQTRQEKIDALYAKISAAFSAANDARNSGELGRYAREVDKANGYFDDLMALLNGTDSGSGGGSGDGTSTPSSSPTDTTSTSPTDTPSTSSTPSATAGPPAS